VDCSNHPGVAAVSRCTGCADPFCAHCLVDMAGQLYCASCKVMGVRGKPMVDAPPPYLRRPQAYGYGYGGAPVPPGMGQYQSGGYYGGGYQSVAMQTPLNVACRQHSDVWAVSRCGNCQTAVCPTCDILIPGGWHLCPACATDPGRLRFSPGRRGLVGWSIGLAAWCTVGLILMVAGACAATVKTEKDLQMVGCGMLFFSMLPALIGLVLGIVSMGRVSRARPVVWVGPIWNGFVLLIWILLMIVGNMRG
jgi:hypothetical protein